MLQNKQEILDYVESYIFSSDFLSQTFNDLKFDLFDEIASGKNTSKIQSEQDLENFVNLASLDGYTTKPKSGKKGAWDLIKQYTYDHYDKNHVDKHDPCDIANMIDHIRGTNAINHLLEVCGYTDDVQINKQTASKFIYHLNQEKLGKED